MSQSQTVATSANRVSRGWPPGRSVARRNSIPSRTQPQRARPRPHASRRRSYLRERNTQAPRSARKVSSQGVSVSSTQRRRTRPQEPEKESYPHRRSVHSPYYPEAAPRHSPEAASWPGADPATSHQKAAKVRLPPSCPDRSRIKPAVGASVGSAMQARKARSMAATSSGRSPCIRVSVRRAICARPVAKVLIRCPMAWLKAVSRTSRLLSSVPVSCLRHLVGCYGPYRSEVSCAGL